MNVKVNLRVYKRTDEQIILFWNNDMLNDDQTGSVKIYLIDKSEESEEPSPKDVKDMKEIKFLSADANKLKDLGTAKNVSIAVIDQAENGIDSSRSVLIRLELGVASKITSFLRISPAGVLPMFERDSKNQHVQLFGFCKEKNMWGKVPLVKTKSGQYAIPMVIVEDQTK
jgi:hypothetical protein